jgi:Transposase DDE domain group 1
MKTECKPEALLFQTQNRRELVAHFDGGNICSDAGGLLLQQTERVTGIIKRFAACFTDHRDPDLIEHTVEELIAQRIYALALGYEDLNDHDELRNDPLLAVLVGKHDPTGKDRLRSRDKGKALAGKSTLNRLELTPVGANKKSRYKKITVDRHAVEAFFTEIFLDSYSQAPSEIILDLDATDDPLHGNQAGRFFHGYYKNYCYLPLYTFCGEHLLCARLRPSDIDACAGSVKELDRMVSKIRVRWPDTQIIIRGDSGFCRDYIMNWCELNNVDYVLGLAKNQRLKREIAAELEQAQNLFHQTDEPARVFKDFRYQTLKSWSRSRRVVGKAEHLEKGENPRFVVTSLSTEQVDARTLYEQTYCGRGDMENRIKEQQLWLFADRTSCATMRANQLRLWFSSVAYTLMQALRRLGLKGTKLAKAQCGTIRVKLLKIGARIRVTVRKIWVSFSESYPYQQLFREVYGNLIGLCPMQLRC